MNSRDKRGIVLSGFRPNFEGCLYASQQSLEAILLCSEMKDENSLVNFIFIESTTRGKLKSLSTSLHDKHSETIVPPAEPRNLLLGLRSLAFECPLL
jgi:hypothetical protein